MPVVEVSNKDDDGKGKAKGKGKGKKKGKRRQGQDMKRKKHSMAAISDRLSAPKKDPADADRKKDAGDEKFASDFAAAMAALDDEVGTFSKRSLGLGCG